MDDSAHFLFFNWRACDPSYSRRNPLIRPHLELRIASAALPAQPGEPFKTASTPNNQGVNLSVEPYLLPSPEPIYKFKVLKCLWTGRWSYGDQPSCLLCQTLQANVHQWRKEQGGQLDMRTEVKMLRLLLMGREQPLDVLEIQPEKADWGGLDICLRMLRVELMVHWKSKVEIYGCGKRKNPQAVMCKKICNK